MTWAALLSPQALLGAGAGFLGGSLLAPVSRLVSHSTNNIWPNEVLDVGSMVRLAWTHPQFYNRLLADQRLVGYSEEKIQDFLRASIRWPTVDEILQLVLLGKIDADHPFEFVDTDGTPRLLSLKHLFHGAQVPDEMQNLFEKIIERPLPLGTTLALWRRFGTYLETVDEEGNVIYSQSPVGGKYFDMFVESRKAEGFERMDSNVLLDAFRQYPGVPDLIRFAVREVYTPEINERFGQFEDYPEQFAKEARKAGLSVEDSKRYWAAHWKLPSVRQGFEMFHRGHATLDDLRLLLRAQDVMPFWRDKLIQISYRVKRLVDIYRLYEQRVIPRIDPNNLTEQTPLVREFLDRGYNPEDAKALSLWLDRTRPDPGTEATIKAATRSYEKGFIDDQELESVFDELTLPAATRSFLLTASKANRQQKRLEITIRRLKPRLLDGLISETQFIQELQQFNLSSTSIRGILDQLEAEYADKKKGLTEAQVLRLYKGGYLKNKAEAVDLLIRSGRTQRAAEVLVQEADDDFRTGSDSIPLTDMKGFFAKGLVTEELFRDYLKALGVPEFGVNAYVESLKPQPERGFPQ